MPAPANPALGAIPSVDRVLRDLGETRLPRAVVVSIVRRELETLRQRALAGAAGDGASFDHLLATVRRRVEEHHARRIRPVVNGTGIIVHTNLGRSPLADEAVAAIAQAARGYCNLEYDLVTGRRGGRGAGAEAQLAVLCETEAATVVNNCAAAMVLVLRHFATGRRPKVVISRGELVQIGGGFRIPDILEASGATLREIGTTNRTTLDDYRRAIDGETGLVLKVHRSNFYMEGFVESPAIRELAALARERNVPLVEDLGSGAAFPTESLGGEHEPTPAESLRQGADLVTFSGDKLLGGPQAGIIAGARAHVAALRANPLFRALRCDKLVLSALEATVDLHLHGRSDDVPIIAMMRHPLEALRARAQRLLERLTPAPVEATMGDSVAQVGGGSLPRTELPSVSLDLRPADGDVDALAARLRTGATPVVGHIEAGRLRIDLRTVFPHEDEVLARAILSALSGGGS